MRKNIRTPAITTPNNNACVHNVQHFSTTTPHRTAASQAWWSTQEPLTADDWHTLEPLLHAALTVLQGVAADAWAAWGAHAQERSVIGMAQHGQAEQLYQAC